MTSIMNATINREILSYKDSCFRFWVIPKRHSSGRETEGMLLVGTEVSTNGNGGNPFRPEQRRDAPGEVRKRHTLDIARIGKTDAGEKGRYTE